jgi:transposase
MLNKLNLACGTKFNFIFDFGRYHIFRLTVLEIASSQKREDAPSCISYKGNNLLQYPGLLSQKEEQAIVNKTPTIQPPKPVRDRWLIRFVRGDDHEILLKWRNSKDKDLWDKAVAVLENHKLSLEEISKKIERSIRVIKNWIADYNHHGVNCLNSERKKRRPDKKTDLAEQRKTRLMEILHDRPQSFDINRSNWNHPSLAFAYNKKFGEQLSKSTISRLLRATGYTIKKARRVLTSPDSDYREKVDLVLATLQNLKSDELFFFIDELGPLRVKKYGGKAVVFKDEVPTYPQVQQHRGSITMAGALCATTNQVTWFYGPSKDSQLMIDLIEILFNQHPMATQIYLTWDAASWHSSNQLVEWLDEFNAETAIADLGPIIHLVPLPTSSQFLDVIESIFSGMKRAVIHHSDYKSETEMKSAISRHFMERNAYFAENPKRVGKKIWEVDFFQDINSLRSGNYREW